MTHARAAARASCLDQVGHRHVMLALALAGSLLACAGCASSPRSARGLDQRPTVAQSAVEAIDSSSDEGGLGFFDALESRPLASQDDAIHAALLLGTGSSAPTAPQRITMASALGYLPANVQRSPRDAVTIGEVAEVLAPILEGRPIASQEAALTALRARGVTIGTGLPNQGLTGAQLMSVVGAMQDAMSAAGIQKVPAPLFPSAPGAAAPAAGEVSAITAVDDGVPAPLPSANTALDAVGRNEPLPPIPPGSNPPAIEVQDPSSNKPAVIGPAGTITSGTKTTPKPKAGTKLAPMPPAPGNIGEAKPAQVTPPAPIPAQPVPKAMVKPKSSESARSAWLRGQPLKPKSNPVDPPVSPSSATATAEEPK